MALTNGVFAGGSTPNLVNSLKLKQSGSFWSGFQDVKMDWKPQSESKSFFETNGGKASILGGLASISGIGQGLTQNVKNRALESQASGFEAQREMALLNENLARIQLEGAYKTGAYQAMVQGLQDRQVMAHEVARQGSSGTVIGQGSNKNIMSTQKMSAQLNQITIQQNTVANANQARLAQAQARAQAIIAQGNADAARAQKQSGLMVGILSSISTAGQFAQMYFTNGMGSFF